MPFINGKLIPLCVNEGMIKEEDDIKYEAHISYLTKLLQNIYDLLIDEDDQEVNQVWKEYTETEVSGRLCAQYLQKVIPRVFSIKNASSKEQKNSQLQTLLESISANSEDPLEGILKAKMKKMIEKIL